MLIQKMRRIIVSNGTNIRRNSIAFSALIGSIGGSVLEIVSEKFINLNYSCTSGTASANGCALSDSCKADNLPSFPLKKRRTTPLDFQIFI